MDAFYNIVKINHEQWYIGVVVVILFNAGFGCNPALINALNYIGKS